MIKRYESVAKNTLRLEYVPFKKNKDYKGKIGFVMDHNLMYCYFNRIDQNTKCVLVFYGLRSVYPLEDLEILLQ